MLKQQVAIVGDSDDVLLLLEKQKVSSIFFFVIFHVIKAEASYDQSVWVWWNPVIRAAQLLVLSLAKNRRREATYESTCGGIG